MAKSPVNVYDLNRRYNNKIKSKEILVKELYGDITDEKEREQMNKELFAQFTLESDFYKRYTSFNAATVVLGAKRPENNIKKFADIDGAKTKFSDLKDFFFGVANINDFLNKKDSGSELIKNTIKYNQGVNYSMLNTKSGASITTLKDTFKNFKDADSFYVFDLETLSGLGKTGYNELDSIQEVAFRKFKKVNGEVKEVVEDRIETLIGISDEQYEHYKKIFIKDFEENGLEGVQKYKVIAERFAKLGHYDTTISSVKNGLATVETYAADDAENLMSKSNILRGLERANQLWHEQENQKLANGLTAWQDAMLRGIDAFNNNFTMGYNSTNFDFKRYNQAVAQIWSGMSPEQKKPYMKMLGLSEGVIPTINGSNSGKYMDVLDAVKVASGYVGKTGIYGQDNEAISNVYKLGKTLLQQESLGKTFVQDIFEKYPDLAPHTAGADVTVLANLAHGGFLDNVFDIINKKGTSVNTTIDYNSVLVANRGERFNDFSREGALNFTYDKKSGIIRTGNGYAINADGIVEDWKEYGRSTGLNKNVAYQIGFMGELEMSDEWIDKVKEIDQTYAQGKLWAVTFNPLIDKEVAGDNELLENPHTYLFTSKEAMEGMLSSSVHHVGNYENGKFTELADPRAAQEIREQYGLYSIKDGKAVKVQQPENIVEDIVRRGTVQRMNDPAARMQRGYEYTKARSFMNMQDYMIDKGITDVATQKKSLELATKVSSGKALKINYTDTQNILGYLSKEHGKKIIRDNTLNNYINSYEYMASQRPVLDKVMKAIDSYGDIDENRKQILFETMMRNIREDAVASGIEDTASEAPLLLYGKDLNYFEFDMPEGYFKPIDKKAMPDEIDNVLRVNLGHNGEYSLVDNILKRTRGMDFKDNKVARNVYGKQELKKFIEYINGTEEYKGKFDKLLYGKEKTQLEDLIAFKRYEKSNAKDNVYADFDNALKSNIDNSAMNSRERLSNLKNQRDKIKEQLKNKEDNNSYLEKLEELNNKWKASFIDEEEWNKLNNSARDLIISYQNNIHDEQLEISESMKNQTQELIKELDVIEKEIDEEYKTLFGKIDEATTNTKSEFSTLYKDTMDKFNTEIGAAYDKLQEEVVSDVQSDISANDLAEKFILQLRDMRKDDISIGRSKNRTMHNVLGPDTLMQNVSDDIIDSAIRRSKEEAANYITIDTKDANAIETHISKMVDEIFMPTVKTEDGRLLKNIDEITNYAQELYGYNKETAELFSINLKMQREEHIKGWKKFGTEVMKNGGKISYDKESRTVDLLMDGTLHKLYGMPKTTFTNGVLALEAGNRKYATYFNLDVDSAMRDGRLDKSKVAIKSTLSDIYKDINYLNSNITRAQNRGESVSDAIMRTVSNVYANVREYAAIGPSTTKDMYAWQKVDTSEAIQALPYMLDEIEAYDGWLDSDTVKVIKRNKNKIKKGSIASEVSEAFMRENQDFVKMLIGIGAGNANPLRSATEKVLAYKNTYAKDSKLAKGIEGVGDYNPKPLIQFDGGARPPGTSADEILYSKKELDDFIKANEGLRVEADSRLITKRQINGKKIQGVGNVATGLSYTNLSISEKKLREKIEDRFTYELQNHNLSPKERERLLELKKQLSGLNITEQEKLMNGKVFEFMFKHAEDQRIGTLKDFIDNTELATKMMKERVRNSMPAIDIAKSGDIVFKLGKGQYVTRGEALFGVKQYGGGVKGIGVTEDAGFFKYGFYGKDSTVLASEEDISKFLTSNKDKILNKDGTINLKKAHDLLNNEYSANFYVESAFLKGNNKATIEYAEKGMYTALLSGAGNTDKRITELLRATGLEIAENRILKDEFIDLIEERYKSLPEDKKKALGFNSWEDIKSAIIAEKYQPTEFMQRIEDFKDVVAYTNDNVIKHSNVGTATTNFINSYAYSLELGGMQRDEAYKEVEKRLRESKVFDGFDIEYKDGKIIFGEVSQEDGKIMIDNLTNLANESGIYNIDNSLTVTGRNGEVIGHKFVATTAANIDYSMTSRSNANVRSISKALDDTRRELKAIKDPSKIEELRERALDLEYRLDIAKASDKKMKISSREMDMMRMYTYDEKRMGKVKNKLDSIDNKLYRKVYGDILDGNNGLKAEYIGKAINSEFLDEVEKDMIEYAKEVKPVWDAHINAIKYNAGNQLNEDFMLDKAGFEYTKLEDLIIPQGEGTDFLLGEKNSSVGRNLLIDTGLSGKDQYLAIAGDVNYINGGARFRNGELDGNTLNNDEVQKSLKRLERAKQNLVDGRNGDKGILENKTIADLEANVSSAVQEVREAMEGASQKLTGELGQGRLDRYSYKKASMIGADTDYHMFDKSIIDGKTVAEWQKEGVYHNMSWEGLKHFEDQGYFKEETLKKYGFTTKDEMMDYLETYGTMGVNQRTPTIKEGSITIERQYLDRQLPDVRKSMSYTGFRKNQDQDGDHNISAELTKNDVTFAEYQRMKQLGSDIDPEVEKYFRSLEASNTYDAIMINPKVQKNIASVGYNEKDVKAAVENANVVNVARGKANLNDKFITPLSHSEIDSGRMKNYRAKYGEIESALKNRMGDEAYGKLEQLDRVKEMDKYINTLSENLRDEYTEAMRYMEIFGKDTGAKMSKVAGKVSIGYINTPLATMRRVSSVIGVDGDDQKYLQAMADVFEQGIISKKHASDIAISVTQDFRDSVNGMLRGDTKSANNIKRLMATGDFEDKIYDSIINYSDLDENMSKEEVIGNVHKAISNFASKARSRNDIEDIIAAENAATKLTGSNADKVLRGFSENSSGASRVFAKSGYGSNSTYGKNMSYGDGKTVLSGVGKAIGEAVENASVSSSGLGLAALGIAGAIMATGYIGGNPTVPADNQAESMSDRYNSLQDEDLSIQSLPGGTGQGYVININAESEKGQQHAIEAVQKAMQSSVTTDINISMNMQNKQGNISSRLIDQMLAGAL